MPLGEVRSLAQELYGEMVKAVADIDKQVIAIGGEMHADAEAVLLDQGSSQENLWGFNIYPDKEGEKLAYTSLINIKPRQGNRSQFIEDNAIKSQIKKLVSERIPELKL